MRQAAGRVHAIGGWLYTAGVLLQIYLAGLGVFGATTFAPHVGLGYSMILIAVVLLVLSLLAARAIGSSALLLIFSVVQVALVQAGAAIPAVAALHLLNALVLLYLGHAVGRGLSSPLPGEAG